MQDENNTISAFCRRTDALAEVLRVPLTDLPEKLNISKAMLFGYRSGRNRITGKAWERLKTAERAAGISPNDAYIFDSTGDYLENLTKDMIVEWVLGDAEITLKFVMHVATDPDLKDATRKEIPKTVATLRARREEARQQQS